MPFTIRPYHRKQAKRLGVTIRKSRNKGKKLDVLKNGQKVAAIGASGYKDYAEYLAMEKAGKVAKGTAAAKRKAYKARHQKYRTKKESAAYYADQILW